MKHIAFIDMDDTLLGPSKTISPENLRALDKLRAAGVQIVIASGRHQRNIASYQDMIPDMDWMISSHGAVVESRRTGEALHELCLPPAPLPDICRRAREQGAAVMAYHRTGIYTEELTEWILFHARTVGWQPQVRDFSTLPPDRFQKIMWTAEAARITALAAPLQEEFTGRVQVLRTEPELLEFFSTAVNKANGAQALLSHLGLPRSRALAFGDGSNDIELLRWAGISVAMSHGNRSALQAAKHITPAGPRETAFARGVEIALRAIETARSPALRTSPIRSEVSMRA